jgi:2-keto-3-deoxy-L-rhamnonate aldolase RhmA
MQRSDLRQRLKSGETLIGTMVQEVRTPAIAQILKQVGFDFFMLDMEHGTFNLETAAEIVRTARLAGIAPLVRVAGPQYELIGRILDQGAVGVMLPRVETRAEVELLVQSVKYPPLGKRGMSSDAPHSGYQVTPLAEFVEINNADTIAIAQIERKAAIEDIDDILSVPGVDVALIGPEDLSVSLGLQERDLQARVTRAIEAMIAAARRHDVVSAIHMGNVERLQDWLRKGMAIIKVTYPAGRDRLRSQSVSGCGHVDPLSVHLPRRAGVLRFSGVGRVAGRPGLPALRRRRAHRQDGRQEHPNRHLQVLSVP